MVNTFYKKGISLGFIMAKQVYTIQVTGFDAVNNPFIQPVLVIDGVRVALIVKKKSVD